jgi:urease accessory protein
MLSDRSLYQLLVWNSPGYPTGAFSYSHGLEWAVEEGAVKNVDQLVEFVEAVLERGGGWIDAVIFVQAWRAASIGESALDEIAELGVAFRGTAETALESHQQGSAFLQTTRQVWPHPALERFAQRHSGPGSPVPGSPVAHSVVVALACSVHGVDLQPALSAYLHALAANLVSAGVRLIPLGQTHGQLAIARLFPAIERVTERALAAELDDLGTAAPGLERCSALHETQYTRLFRS